MRQQTGRVALPLILAGLLALITPANSRAQSLLAGPTSLDFVVPDAATQPARQSVFVASSGVPLPYQAKTGYWSAAGDWLSVETASGLTPSTLTVTANPGNLPNGVYFGYVEIASPTAPSAVLNVTLRVGGAAAATTARIDTRLTAALNASPNGIFATLPESLTFHAQTGQAAPRPQSFFLRGAHTQFTANSSAAWASLTSNRNTTPGQSVTGTSASYLQVSVDSTGLGAGEYSASILLDSPATAQRVLPVTLTVSDQPALVAEPSTLSFQLHPRESAPSPQTLTIHSTGQTLNYTASSDSGSWLAIGPQIGSTSDANTVLVTVNPKDLPAANQTGFITVTAPGVSEPLIIPIDAAINAATVGLSVDQTSITLQAPNYTQNLSLTSSAGTEAYSISIKAADASCASAGPNCGLSVTPSTGSTPKTLMVTGNSAVPAGTYLATLDIIGSLNSEEVFVAVTFIVSSGSGGGVTPSPTSVSFTQPALGAAPAPKTVQLSGASGTSFTAAAASTGNWLTVSPTSGTLPSNSTLTLTVNSNAATLAANTYTGSVTVSGSTTPVTVTLVVTGAGGSAITAAPASLDFSQVSGGTVPGAQTVQLTSPTATSFNAAASDTWLKVTPTGGNIPGGSTPATLSITVDATGLTIGLHQGSVSIIGGTSNITVPVNFTVTANPAAITANPASVSFTQPFGGATATAQTVQLSSSTATAFTASSSVPWLTVTSNSTTTPATLTLTPSPSALAAGSYQGMVTITPVGATQTTIVTVAYDITSISTVIAANPASLTFNQSVGGAAPPPQTVVLTAAANTGFIATSNANWLTVLPGSGIAPTNLTVSVNASGLTASPTPGTITIKSGANTLLIPVTFTVAAATTLAATPASVNFVQIFGSASPAPQAVQLTSTNSTAFTASTNVTWLTVSPTAGAATPATLTFTAATSSLAVGSYTALVTITAGTTSITVPVTLTVYAPGAITITTNPPAVAFSQTFGEMALSLKNIQLSAPSAIGFTATSDSSWLLVSPMAGSTPATLTLTGTAGMPVGVYQGNITVTTLAGGVAPVTIPVSLTVSLAPNAIAAAPAQVTFSQVQGSAAPLPQTVQLASPNPTAFTVTTPTSAWLTVTPTTGTTPASLSFTVNTSGLSIGSYTDSVTVNGGATPVTIPVTLTINTDALTPTPASLAFTQTVGAAGPSPQTVRLTSGASRFFTASTTSSWLTIAPTTGTTPATLTITANGAGLAVGINQGTVTLNGAGPAISIPVTLTIAAATGATFTPATLAFSVSPTSPAPAPQTVAVSSPGSPFSFNATAQAANLGTWLSVTPTSGTTPATLSVSVAPTGLAAGNYTGLVTVTPTDPSFPAQSLTVTLNVSGGTTSSTIFVRSVLNAASFLPGPIAAGEIVTLTGAGLGPTTGVGPTILSSGAIDTKVAGTRVLFDGIPSPLLYVRADQINAIVPYNVYGRTATNLQVEVAGVLSDVIGLQVQNTATAIFTTDGSGRGTGAIINQDGTVNGPSFPAPPGSIVAIYGTGEGQTIPAGQDGRIVSTDVRSPIAAVSARIGGVPVQVRYAGSAPGQVSGLFQINLLVPANLATGGQLPVDIQIGNIVSQAGVTMAVK